MHFSALVLKVLMTAKQQALHLVHVPARGKEDASDYKGMTLPTKDSLAYTAGPKVFGHLLIRPICGSSPSHASLERRRSSLYAQRPKSIQENTFRSFWRLDVD